MLCADRQDQSDDCMAGQPRKRAMIAELQARAIAMDPKATPLDYVEDWISSGNTILALAADISKTTGEEITRAFLSRWIHTSHPDAERRLDAARKTGAHAMAEGAMGIVEDLKAPTREELAHAKLKVDTRWWIAERWNRDDLGSKTAMAVTITGDDMLLDALRVRVVEQTPTLPALAPADADYEIVEEAAAEQQAELEL